MINVEGAAVERAAGKTLMPFMHAAWSFGGIIGAGIGAGCAALGIAPEWQFLGEAVLIVAAATVATRFIPVVVQTDVGVSRPPRAGRVRSWLRGWRDGRLLLIGLVMLGVELGEGTANNWLTLAVRAGHDQSDAVAALFFVAFAVSETIARVAGGPVVDRIGRVRAVRVDDRAGRGRDADLHLAGPGMADPCRHPALGGRGLDGFPARHVRCRADSGPTNPPAQRQPRPRLPSATSRTWPARRQSGFFPKPLDCSSRSRW